MNELWLIMMEDSRYYILIFDIGCNLKCNLNFTSSDNNFGKLIFNDGNTSFNYRNIFFNSLFVCIDNKKNITRWKDIWRLEEDSIRKGFFFFFFYRLNFRFVSNTRSRMYNSSLLNLRNVAKLIITTL